MLTRTNHWLRFVISPLLIFVIINGIFSVKCIAQSISLYTPYTEISVPPGEAIDYSIDVINNSNTIREAEISVQKLPEDWNYELKSGGWSVGRIAVLPDEKKNLTLNITVPLKIEKGTYRFFVVANGYDRLPITVNITKEGTFKTEFSSKQANMEGAADSKFTFSATLRNSTGEPQVYALNTAAPRGWNVIFKANYKQVSSVRIEPNSTQDLTIEIDPPHQIKAGTYKIPLRATTKNTSADLGLEVVITGSYELELTTPTGLLSTDITAGDERRVELLLRNTGSADLETIKMDFTAPSKWDVVFDPKEVGLLESGANTTVFATIKADLDAIAGDYVTKMKASTPEVSDEASFRVSVKTPLLWGWTGILIILVALGSVYYLFRTYGRR